MFRQSYAHLPLGGLALGQGSTLFSQLVSAARAIVKSGSCRARLFFAHRDDVSRGPRDEPPLPVPTSEQSSMARDEKKKDSHERVQVCTFMQSYIHVCTFV